MQSVGTRRIEDLDFKTATSIFQQIGASGVNVIERQRHPAAVGPQYVLVQFVELAEVLKLGGPSNCRSQ